MYTYKLDPNLSTFFLPSMFQLSFASFCFLFLFLCFQNAGPQTLCLENSTNKSKYE